MAISDDGPQQLRLRVNLAVTVHGVQRPRRGDVVLVPDLRTAARYLAQGYAQPVWEDRARRTLRSTRK
jgi:hypothetical protein